MRQVVKLDLPDANGNTRRKHIESALRMMKKDGKTNPSLEQELKPVEPMLGTERLLNCFWRINTARGEGANGYLPISYSELKSYCELMDDPLTPWEVEAVKAMDAAFLDQYAEARKR